MKKLVLLPAVLSLCLAAAGCGLASSVTPADKPHYPVTVTTYNQAGEAIEITYEKAPEKIVSCNQQTTELILELGLVNKVAGTAYLDNPIRASLAGDYAKTKVLSDRYPSKEAVIGAGADFIIGWASAFDEKALGGVADWHGMGVNTMIPRNNILQPNNIDNLIKDVRDLGMIFDIEEVTEAYIADFEARLAAVKEKTKTVETPLRVLFVTPTATGSYWIHGKDRLVGEIISLAGGVNIPDATVSASNEDLIKLDPDMLFVVKAYNSGLSQSNEEVIAAISSVEALSDMRAIKENRIYPVELADFVVGNGRTIPAIENYAKTMYPENF